MLLFLLENFRQRKLLLCTTLVKVQPLENEYSCDIPALEIKGLK